MAAGSISESRFLHAVQDFLSRSKKLGDDWTLQKVGDDVYLQMEVRQKLDLVVPDKDNITVEFEEDGAEEDAACLVTKGDNCDHILTFDYHIVYSQSYSVPVLYFNAYMADGRLLPLDQVWSLVPKHYQERLTQDRWTFLTQQEHPFLGRPFYQLHPCHTQALMSCAASIDQSAASNYLVTWLSCVGPVVGLDIPMSYAASVGD